jgi:cell wall-associated NlpC family hydrolase
MPNTGIMVATALGGGILLWSGINNKGVLATARDILQGTKPVPGAKQSFTLGASNGSAAGTGGVPAAGTAATSSAIANTALSYVGSRYVWGGAGGTVKGVDAGTDCSGFCNMVIGRDHGLAIPGYPPGAYSGAAHGPATGGWLLWSGVTAVTAAELQPGDLLVWPTHMGFALGGGQMVSALDTNDGVKVTTIAGGTPPGEPVFCKRLASVTPAAGTGAPDTAAYLG